MSDERSFKMEEKSIDPGLQPRKSSRSTPIKGLKIEPHFSTPGTHPFEEIEWETRAADIRRKWKRHF